jgi:malonate-semialdehyde dehydrogenase (acetylating) / methylmalonate-semialdehyde dehydrogenase
MSTIFSGKSYDFVKYADAQNYIGGQWVDAQNTSTLEVINPRHAQSMGDVVMSGAEDVASAVAAAKAALPAWQERPIRERGEVMYKLRQLMHDNLEELTWLVSHENGKTYGEAKAEVLKAIECAEYGCSLPNIAAAPQLEVSRGVDCRIVYEPVGIVAGVTPFNFPLMVPLWMLPQALVGGNAFILKPSEQVPLSCIRLAEMLKDAGLPDGIFNIINGGQEAVEALCDNEEIGALSFVGSTRVAKIVYGRAAQTGKRVLCLGGAKNHLIVVPDADLELTAQNVTASYTGCAGQRCMAASVMVAVGDVDQIIDAVVEHSKRIELGKDLGAIVNEASVERITRYINEAEAQGAKILVDGRGTSGANGYWVGPTLIDHVSPDMPAAKEEIFGPVLSIVRVNNLDEAIELENSSEYGNASAVYTTSGDVARKVMNQVSAGMCGVNIGVPVPREPFGFGGWNDSKFGHGNITGWDGYRFWTRPRKISSKWAVQKDTNWMS